MQAVGGAAGNMICVHNVVAASAVVGMLGREGLVIRRDGAVTKFVHAVEQITFNARHALAKGQTVTAITERGVFAITEDGPLLTEVAPGVDVERDIMARMAFRPRVSADLKPMAEFLFRPEHFDLAAALRR